MRYEIRVYYKRYNIDPEYYCGTRGIRRRWKAKTRDELLRKWKQHLDEFEGDTYSVWDGDEIIIGGAYDPGDLEYIERYCGVPN